MLDEWTKGYLTGVFLMTVVAIILVKTTSEKPVKPYKVCHRCNTARCPECFADFPPPETEFGRAINEALKQDGKANGVS